MFLEKNDEQEQLAKNWGFKTSDIRELSNQYVFWLDSFKQMQFILWVK